jgi:hypothetical protein
MLLCMACIPLSTMWTVNSCKLLLAACGIGTAKGVQQVGHPEAAPARGQAVNTAAQLWHTAATGRAAAAAAAAAPGNT